MAKNITFKKDRDKQRIDELLAGKRIRNRMPDKVKGKCAPMVLWAIEYLANLIEGGVDNLQSELFAGTSEETEVMTYEYQQLKLENEQLQKKVMTLEARNEELTELADGYVETINMLLKSHDFLKGCLME